MQTVKKAVLAYSGGLDTSIIIPWLKDNYGCQVVAVAADVGQGAELDGLEAKALATGAQSCFIEDLRDEFVREYVWPTLQAGAVYEGQYLLGTSMARPVIAKRLVEIALREGADAIVHGCTGKGNDQVRFELGIKAFAPQLKIIAPWREWELKSREDEIAYAEARGIPLTFTRETSYSRDRNLWHLSHEGLDLEDPNAEPDYANLLQLCVPAEAAPNKPQYITISFEKGVPVALNGTAMDGVKLLETLNTWGGAHGVGVIDIVENRLVGMKSRGVYETPGGTILYAAHRALETITLDKDTARTKESLAPRFADLVYNGQWFTPLRAALSAFVNETQQLVTGTVRLKLYKGHALPVGVESPHSLYDHDLASFGESAYNQQDAAGFINLFGLPLTVAAIKGRKVPQ